MKQTKNKFHHILKYLRSFFLTAGICIGAYGIITAPSSDANQLEKELEKNACELARDEESPAAISTAPVKASALPSSVSSHNSTPKRPEKQYKKPTETFCASKINDPVSVIGDSVFLGAAPAFKKIYKNTFIDAKISRQVVQGLDIAKNMDRQGKLADTVIIALGTNGCFNSSTAQKLIDYLGPDRTIYWIDAYGRNLPVQENVNKTIRKVAKANPNVQVIAWSKEGRKHPDWFYQDGIHLNITGQKKYARFIYKNVFYGTGKGKLTQ